VTWPIQEPGENPERQGLKKTPKRMAAAYDLRQVRKGVVDDPLIYGDDIIVIEQSASKTALRRFIESVPVLGIFNVL